jgi:hypothetical protein
MMHNSYVLGAAVVAIIIVIFVAGLLVRRRPRKLNGQYFGERWKEAQALCSNKNTWPLAIINADKLLDDALKRSHYKGKTMGERLVAAQRDLSSNDGVWYGHKLRNQLVHEENVKLTKRIVQNAMLGLRQALKDLGALK